MTVLLVDDVAELRAVVRQALRLRGGFEVVAEAGGGTEAIDAARRHQPDVVVLDLGLPDLAGREVLGGLRQAAPSAHVVVYTGSMTSDRVEVAGQVEGFVRKDQDVGYLVDLLADLGRRRHRAATIELGPDARDVARGRRFLGEQLRLWGCHDVAADALLVATELVTNAFIHAGDRCQLSARLASGILRLEVRDQGPGVPDPRDSDVQAEGGRGLMLVSGLATAWGVDAMGTSGKVVWAELVSSPDLGSEPPAGRAADQGQPSGRPGGIPDGGASPGRSGEPRATEQDPPVGLGVVARHGPHGRPARRIRRSHSSGRRALVGGYRSRLTPTR